MTLTKPYNGFTESLLESPGIPNYGGCGGGELRGGAVDVREGRVVLGHSFTMPKPWCSADVMIVPPAYREAASSELPLPCPRILVVGASSPAGTGQAAGELAERYGRPRLEVDTPGRASKASGEPARALMTFSVRR